MVWLLLLCFFAVDCYSFEVANQKESENICKLLDQNEIKQLVIAQSESLRPPPNYRWYLKNEENIIIKDAKENASCAFVYVNKALPKRLDLKIDGKEWWVLYPSTYALLQQADTFVNKVYFISEKGTYAVNAVTLRNLLNNQTHVGQLEEVEQSYECCDTKKHREAVIDKIAEWKQRHQSKPEIEPPNLTHQDRREIDKSVIVEPPTKKFFLISGGLCLLIGIILGVFLEKLRVQYC